MYYWANKMMMMMMMVNCSTPSTATIPLSRTLTWHTMRFFLKPSSCETVIYENENENENRLFGMAAMHAGFT